MGDKTQLKMVQHLEERIIKSVPSKIRFMDVSVDSKAPPIHMRDDDIEVLFEAKVFSHKTGPVESLNAMRSRAVRELTHHLYGDVYDALFDILHSAYDDQYKTGTTDKIEALLSKLRP